jgi:hypothetical protein
MKISLGKLKDDLENLSDIKIAKGNQKKSLIEKLKREEELENIKETLNKVKV